jgi:outer membrane protein TolC
MSYQLLIPFFCLLIIAPISVSALTLEDYLEEVREKNGAVRGLKISTEAKTLRRFEGSLFFRPSFFLNSEYYDDQRPTNAPTFQGTQTLRHTLRGGLSQSFRTGTKATFSYNYFKTQINGVNPALIPNRKFFDVSPQIEITQSLWRNFLGSEFEASEKAQIALVDAQKWNDQYLAKQILLNAENAFWRLYVAQTSLIVLEDSLERAKKIRDWNANRVRNNLTDESDLVQSEANLQSREINLQDIKTEIDTALRDFNSFRQVEGEEVNLEGTKGKDSSYILDAALPPKIKIREDVRAFLANKELALANAELGRQRNRPNLDLYASYSINGRDANSYRDAHDMAMTNTRPFSIYGIRFTMPLDISALNDYKKAYAQEVTASDLQFKRKQYEVDREYEILRERFENFKKRLKLTQRMVQIQEKKLTVEKRRYGQGRTTTFQVLQFEQDFAETQLLKLRYERELITVYNQLKLFSGVEYDQQ